jgi:transglutaminase/protease-like cytokinesis protein 3
MAGNTLLDVSEFKARDPLVNVTDAMYEAFYQNPFILESSISGFSESGNLVWVRFTASGPDFEAKLPQYRESLLQTGQQIVASIITPGMSDREKAMAINRWLMNNVVYDYHALELYRERNSNGNYDDSFLIDAPYAWNAIGALQKGTGVCASFAAGFKLLADLAGLDAVEVTGPTPYGRHAWNKAKIDGKWRIIDSTWNTGTHSLQYFGLTDAEGWEYTQDKYWMVDAYIHDYDAI